MTIDQQIAAVARELALREGVYPKWVQTGRLKKEKADHELAAMKAVIETLKAVKMDPASAAALVAQYRDALEQCVRVAKAWHGADAFELYFNHSPEMKPIRDVLGTMPDPT